MELKYLVKAIAVALRKRALFTANCLAAVLMLPLLGCGIDPAPVSTSGAGFQGRVHGGQQPVSGATIALYAAGLTGDGTGASNLLGTHVVTTDSTGSFSITGDYLCPTATTPVYLVARGGNPGLAVGTSNAALVLVAALGDCGNLSSSTYVWINEATTVAAAWALSPFMGSGADVGAGATNLKGLRNAFDGIANLVDPATGSAPGAALPEGASTETAKLYSLANILATCVNSDGATACAPLFAAATETGVVPSNTLDAALSIVRNPAANVASVFDVSPANGPFQPGLDAAPHDWTLSVTFGNCAPGCGGLDLPGDLAIDASGSVWVSNYFGGVVSKFSAVGVPAAVNGFPGLGLNQSYGLAVDGSGNAWVTNEESVSGANNHHAGSISEFSPFGTELSGYGYTGGGVYYPQSVAADSNGEIWVADYGSSSATLLASDGSGISGNNGYGTAELPFTTAVAVDTGHNAWFAVQKAAVRVSPLGVVTSFACCSDPVGIAVDQSNNIWIADYEGLSIVELTSSGAVANRVSTAAAPTGPQGIAIDGAGNVWIANYFGNSVSQILGASATTASPAAGLGLDAPLNEPYGIAIDASGSVWISNSGGDTITQFVGIASPVRTPLLGAPQQP
jgi:streptogramin lyase